MTTKLGTILADFTTNLATSIPIGGTTATLQSATDDDAIALPAGRYFFTLDGENSNKEHFSCDLSGVALTNLQSISRQGAETVGAVRPHRIGCTVSLTDFAHIKFINDLLNGTTKLNASTPLEYDVAASITGSNQLATKGYVDSVAIAGAPDSSTTTKGITKMSVAPASPTSPIAVGDNDTRVPTQNENDALVGTSGTPVSASNPLVDQADKVNIGAPSGVISPYAGFAAPSGWLLADGTAVSRVTYATLFNVLNPNIGKPTITLASPGVVSLVAHGLVLDDIIYFTNVGNQVVTITIATPGVVTLNNHGLLANDPVIFSTTGALPTGITAGTTYYVSSAGLTTNTFRISATPAGADINTTGTQSGVQTLTGALPTGITANTRYYVISAGLTADAFEFSATKGGSAINTSVSQSGKHSLFRSPYGVGDGSTTFNVPNMKGVVAVGRDSTQTEFNAVGETGGEKTHVLTIAELAAHTHGSPYGHLSAGGFNGVVGNNAMTGPDSTATTNSTGSDTAHNNLQPYIALNYIIKT